MLVMASCYVASILSVFRNYFQPMASMFQYIGYTQCIYLTCLAYAGLNTLGSVQILDTYLSTLSEAELIYGFVSELKY